MSDHCSVISLHLRFGFVNGQVSLAWSIALRTQKLYTCPCVLNFIKTDLDTWSQARDGKILLCSRRNTILVMLTLLHSERPKLYGVLAVLSAIG